MDFSEATPGPRNVEATRRLAHALHPAQIPMLASMPSTLAFALQRRRLSLWLAALLALLLVSLTLAITLGPVRISPQQAWLIAAHEIGVRLGLNLQPGDWTSAQFQIVGVRMPRVLLAALVGAGLALVGVAMQAMVRATRLPIRICWAYRLAHRWVRSA